MFSTGLFSSSSSSFHTGGHHGTSAASPSPVAAGKKAQPPQFASFLLPSIPVPLRRRRGSSAAAAAAALRTSSVSSSSAASPPPLCTSPSTTSDADPYSQPGTPTDTTAAFTPQTTTTSDADPYSQPGTPTDTTAAFSSLPLSSQPGGLSRLRPDTLRCRRCSADVALASQIVSKGFTGRHGRAYLVGPCSPSSTPPSSPGPAWGRRNKHDQGGGGEEEGLANITVGARENRQLVTGMHVVADIGCAVCRGNLGWKYVDAAEAAQRYKIGKYILETARVVEFRSWEDGDVDGGGDRRESEDERQRQRVVLGERDGKARAGGSSRRASKEDEWVSEEDDDDDDANEPVVFDSDDEEECEDIFAGVWDASVVAKRRSSRVSSGRR
ncbi:uncharacterized protein E0L32_002328 [Thyridium curvatum]|uniref:Yippee domain-containing protein n=1 Tax=Thyridium curvatum TaxID=1093900 RepID=A0A507AEL1_9PEZI|nr:uncharacterized protein E0L32_002328 [Thyridium curvatum]TPX06832.1 hypothetical protein E0L32_002328 [Thyridium curvatum]